MILLFYVIFFCSLFVSWRAISSISTGMLLLLSVLHTNPLQTLKALDTREKFFLYTCLLFFLIQFMPFSPGWGNSEFWKNIQLKSGVIMVPLAVLLTRGVRQRNKNILMKTYCVALFSSLLYCLFIALKTYMETNNSSVFFYHNLLSPFRHHAVFVSIYTFIALLLLLEEARRQNYLFRPALHYFFAFFFSISIFLLSSKLVITFLIIYVCYYLVTITVLKKNRQRIVLSGIALILVLTALLLTTNNFAGNRLRDIAKGSFSLHRQEHFHPGVYFNGIQFRLLQLRLVPEILTEQSKWWAGTGSSNSQQLLDKKYLLLNMYTGDGKNDRGYLGLNTHNQFLESLLKQGLAGLFVFILLFTAFMLLGRTNGKNNYLFAWLLLAAYTFIESILETQYGIVLFTFFPAFLSTGTQQANLSPDQSD